MRPSTAPATNATMPTAAPAHYDFQRIVDHARQKGYNPSIVRYMAEHATLKALSERTDLLSLPAGDVANFVGNKLTEEIERCGGFKQAYVKHRAITLENGRRIPEQRFEELTQAMRLLADHPDLSKPNPSSVSPIFQMKETFIRMARETAEVLRLFGMDTSTVSQRVASEPALLRNGLADEVRGLIEDDNKRTPEIEGGRKPAATSVMAPTPMRRQ